MVYKNQNYMKKYVLTVSERFPKTHNRAGEMTYFPTKIKDYEKIHTIRANYDLWKKRFEEIEKGNAYLSVRVWEGKPYRSKQLEIFRYDKGRKIGVQSLQMTPLGWFVDGVDSEYTSKDFAKNDGLELPDFYEWFRGKITIDMEPVAIIHFTDFRY